MRRSHSRWNSFQVDDTLKARSSIGEHGKLPFLGTEIRKCNGCLETRVYRKPTDTGLLLHYKSHVDVRYKKSLLKTMLDRAFKVSSTTMSGIRADTSISASRNT